MIDKQLFFWEKQGFNLEKHDPIVKKYGGTSVGSPERIKNVAEQISRCFYAGYKHLAIVVSAMSGETNRLIRLVEEANPHADPKYYDLAVSAGEQVSVALLAAALGRYQIKSQTFLGYQLGILTDQFHSKARIQSIDSDKIQLAWDRNHVAIVAGFQGVNQENEITTLGRGGTDTSAVALAISLKAKFCEINTDVYGVFQVDPRLVPNAKLIEELDFEVALELASLGSKVLQHRCVELAARYQLPIIVRNSLLKTNEKGTIVRNFQISKNLESPDVSGVTLDSNVARITIAGLSDEEEGIAHIFHIIAKENIHIDMIVYDSSNKHAISSIGFTINTDDLPKTLTLLEQQKFHLDEKDGSIYGEKGLAKISAVGVGMLSHTGIAAKMFLALKRANVRVYMISTSEIKISCVIPEEVGEKAVKVLHKTFLET